MNTPNKDVPFYIDTKPYPSQAEDYLALDSGGALTASSTAPRSHGKFRGNHFQQQRGRFSTTPAKYNYNQGPNKTPYKLQYERNQFQGNYHNYSRNNYNSGGQMGYNNRYQTPYRRNFHNTGAAPQQFQQNKGNTFSKYFHATMLEDPWKDLTARYNAIRNSEINLQATTQSDEEIDAIHDAQGSCAYNSDPKQHENNSSSS